ncbi:hypothetical protein CMQ_2208 [Grosmannia clavigera kw1407]|uniref:Uncharacterized protein n=1 Tax=Grosmannia clavigera (strain kw1407 / UAMH 11150) TaxID=655863 RepID=F0XJD7_GROCL|nr:uncharacterized protein CMQ_2208 [Grosmannia clavigera kw1407]EFX02159.1 hypothetical protein CMQ_2208 [Grosmannia clavigera kw1407]
MFAYQEPASRYPRGKRVHTLPLRTSPSAARKWALQSEAAPVESIAITPPGSSVDDMSSVRVQQQHDPNDVLLMGGCDMDMDMAMDDSDNLSAQQMPNQGCDPEHHLAPGPLQPDDIQSTIAGRIPTPLHPSFAVQVRGGSWGQAGASSALRHPVLEDGDMLSASHDLSVPRSLDHASMGDWSIVQNRSLPSPISEIGGEESLNSDMALDQMSYHSGGYGDGALPMSAHSPCYHGSDSHHSPMPTPTRPSASPMDALSFPAYGSDVASVDGDPASQSSPRKGHTRSRHTVVAWTQQPSMKKSFSIGYRSDCEKCRNRVPGHFNHIIVS